MEFVARLIIQTLKKHRTDTTPILLFTCLIALFGIVLNSLVHTRQEPHFFLAVCCSLFLNILLARTRWSAPWLFLYNFIFCLFWGLQFSDQVFSLTSDGLFGTWLKQANLNLFLWIEYFKTWFGYIFQGKLFEDVHIFPLFLFFQLWLSTAWVWLGYKRQWSGVWLFLPIGALITFWVQYKGLSVSFLLIGLFIGFALMMVLFYQKQQIHWETTGLDYPSELWVEWAVITILLILFVLAIGRTAPLVTTKEGWQKINQWVDNLRPQQEQAVGSSIANRNPSTIEEAIPQEALTFTPANLENIGIPLEQSDDTVMRVRVDGPTDYHWRNQIFSTYTGYGWEPAPQYPENLISEQRPPGHIRYRQEFMLNRSSSGQLFAVGDPFTTYSEGVTIQWVGSNPQTPSSGASTLLSGDSRHYQVESWIPDQLFVKDPDFPAQYPEEIQTLYIQLPETLPQRVVELGERITQPAESPLAAAILVQGYLRENIPYNLNTPPAPAGRDVVDYFLFEAPSGFCTYYASAMTVLLRSQGIPARVVSGYAHGEYDPTAQVYRVAASSAHAWVEVYLSGWGWIPFEPTPSQTALTYQITASRQEDEAPSLTPQQWLNRRRWWRAFFALLGCILSGMILWAIWKIFNLRKKFSHTSTHPVIRIYARFLFRLHLSGINQGTGTTPREFLQLNDGLSQSHSTLWSGFTQLTTLYEQTVYSPHPPEGRELASLTHLLRRSLWDWLRLWAGYRWQRIREKLQERK